MTEHTKIPLPGDKPTPATKSDDGASLIERVVRNFDLVQLSSPPIPENAMANEGRIALRMLPSAPRITLIGAVR